MGTAGLGDKGKDRGRASRIKIFWIQGFQSIGFGAAPGAPSHCYLPENTRTETPTPILMSYKLEKSSDAHYLDSGGAEKCF